MSDLETPRSEAGATSSVSALQQEVQALRGLLLGVVTVLIILSGSVNLVLLRQASMARGQLAENQKNIDEYKNHLRPNVLDFWTKLNAFAKTNPDLAQILGKYNFQGPNANTAAPAVPGQK